MSEHHLNLRKNQSKVQKTPVITMLVRLALGMSMDRVSGRIFTVLKLICRSMDSILLGLTIDMMI